MSEEDDDTDIISEGKGRERKYWDRSSMRVHVLVCVFVCVSWIILHYSVCVVDYIAL